VSWTAPTAGSPPTRYELYEATAVSFSGQSMVQNNAALNRGVANKPNGTFYYRARACNAANLCGAYAAGGAIVVTSAPATPGGLNRWNPSQGSWRAEWNAVAGATSYKFTNNADGESTITHNSSLPKQYIEYQCPWDDCPSNKPKSVRACAGSTCGSNADFAP
jgi:hypothetical protein